MHLTWKICFKLQNKIIKKFKLNTSQGVFITLSPISYSDKHTLHSS